LTFLVVMVSYRHFWVLVVWKIAVVIMVRLGLGDGGGVGFDGGGDGG